ncbi:AAA domain-containing protein [Pseudacidovorax intermedius]|uniref:AAA domain-containing protein n=1 Tax=Pseudacidovorax intermedius TaxID=433924 RepID=UPI00034B192B|nr:AAA domain-containing protein [Pseudacidovorax intermedius]
MATLREHSLLTKLLDYVVEQAKEIDPRAYVLTTTADFKKFPKDVAALPGVDLDLKIEGDHIWLQVARLDSTTPPMPSEQVRPYITVARDPQGPDPAINEATLKHRYATDRRTLSEEEALSRDRGRREQVAHAVDEYHPLWLAWAEDEKPRRQTISLYGDLFMLKGRLEAEESAAPSELVWGIGVTAWTLPSLSGASADGGASRVSFQYPLITQAMEIDLDAETHAICVRPRAVLPRLEFDAFGACQVLGAAEVEKQAKSLLEADPDRPPTPFDMGSFEPILKLIAGNLDRLGRYDSAFEGLPAPSDELLATPGWVLLARPRSTNFLAEDIGRLKARLLHGDEIPSGPACFVTPPSDEVIKYEPLSFRGLCGGSRAKGEPRDLFFPLPYNQEQETIVEMLERAPGVSVQGPPGTGKTHTIANIICHYLATGRKVLVTSKGEHALSVLQSKIPEEVRPLTVALLSGDKEGMRQFQSSIEAIVHNLSQLNSRTTAEEIERCKQQIDAGHAELARIDQRVDQIAEQQLSSIEIDGVQMRAQKMAELVVSGQQLHGWLEDDLTLSEEHAPPLSSQEARALSEARRGLGVDLIYAVGRLPSTFALLPTAEVAKLHDALVGLREIDQAEASGQLLSLRAMTPEVLEDARGMLVAVDHVLAKVQQLEELESPWVFELRSRCRRPDFASEQEALKALLTEVDVLVLARSAFLQRPVTLPNGALGNAKFAQAIERASDGGKPFGFMSFGAGDTKDLVAAIRVSGLAPQAAEDWVHVRRYMELHQRVLSFSVRWNQFARELSVPEIKPEVEALRSTEQIAVAAKRAHELATVHDAHLPRLAEKVFEGLPREELRGTSKQLQAVREQLRRHLVRADLAAAATQLAILQEKLAGTSGPVIDKLRGFIASMVGNPDVATERIAAQYAELIGEIKRIESLSSGLATVNDLCSRVANAGAPKWAARLRSEILPSAGDDTAMPANWRDSWNWARIKHHLANIEAREELLTLAQKRHDLERVLAQQYEQLVAKSAWLQTKSQASAKVLSALESYRVAIRKIGRGTGPNATRYRRDAQAAMFDAQGAIPCWVMSHAKVSESMPARLGAFDLVIVDEASQSDLWALPAILRGKKILVVGDDKQVSPSAGFTSAEKISSLRERFLSDQPYARDLTPEKSLYDIASTVFAAERVMLAEHFRCVHPIIEYSNRTFYKNQIRPLRIPKASERIDPPLVDVLIEQGVRDNRDVNKMEAEFIAGEIEAIVHDPKLRGRSIGVVSLLGPEQAKYIYNLVVSRVEVAELERRKFTCGDAYVFQGSERDIMFLSMIADSARHHALSGQGFEQRFNVAGSRARDRMYLVRSVRLSDLSATDVRRTLVEHFSMPLATVDAETPLLDLCESGFERDVYQSLVDLGYRVTPQVKAGAYRIDMVVEGADDTRLAIECDGDEYHGPDRWQADMQRQRILERAGWVFWRCFASTWSLRKEAVLGELRTRLHTMGIEPLGAIEQLPKLVESRIWPPAKVDDPAPPPDEGTGEELVA